MIIQSVGSKQDGLPLPSWVSAVAATLFVATWGVRNHLLAGTTQAIVPTLFRVAARHPRLAMASFLLVGAAMACSDVLRSSGGGRASGGGKGEPPDGGLGGGGTKADSGPVRRPDAGFGRRPDAGPSPSGTYDHSDLVPPGQRTRCLDDHTMQVETTTGEVLYQSECPEGMECVYDICAMAVGQNFPGDPGGATVGADTNYPLACYWPRRIFGADSPNYRNRGNEFWNEFDPAEIKRQRTRCVTVGEIDVGEYTGTAFRTWSAARESDIPQQLHDFSADTPVAGSPFSDLRTNVCGEDDGVFLPSHDPYAWSVALFSGLPTYRQGVRRSDFYVVQAKPFLVGNPPEKLSNSAYGPQSGGDREYPGSLLRACEWQMIGATHLSLYEDEGDTLFWYLRAIGGDGIGLAGLQILSCMCPLATEGEQ